MATARNLAERAGVRFIGIGTLAEAAPLLLRGFIAEDDRKRLMSKGAVGEIIG